MNVIDKAELYSQEANDLANKEMIKRAFYDGYCEAKFHNEAQGLVFVDLRLPRGKHWSNNYLQAEGKTINLRSLSNTRLPIPTLNDVNELINCCKWKAVGDYIYCIGLNQNKLRWDRRQIQINSNYSYPYVELWVKGVNGISRCEIKIDNFSNGVAKLYILPDNYIQRHPIRLVK